MLLLAKFVLGEMVKINLLNLLSVSEECLSRLDFKKYLKNLYWAIHFGALSQLYDSFFFCILLLKFRFLQNRRLSMLLLKDNFLWMLHGYG
jgi:hypothetical protein